MCASPRRGRAGVRGRRRENGFPAGAICLGHLLPTPFSYPSVLLTFGAGEQGRKQLGGGGLHLWQVV